MKILVIFIIVFSLLFAYRLVYTESYQDIENIVPNLTRFEDIRHVLYINLDERTDRRKQAEQEFQRIELPAQRVQGVKTKPGKLGCTLSHIKCLEIAKRNNWSHVMICEDDILFAKDTDLIKKQFDTFLSRHKDWNVIVLGISVLDGVYKDNSSAQIYSAGCTTCYIIRKEYYDTLLNNFKISAKRLRDNEPDGEIDVVWQSLQKKDQWMTILPYLVIQRDGASDIEGGGKYINYQNLLLDNLKNIKEYPQEESKKNTIENFRS